MFAAPSAPQHERAPAHPGRRCGRSQPRPRPRGLPPAPAPPCDCRPDFCMQAAAAVDAARVLLPSRDCGPGQGRLTFRELGAPEAVAAKAGEGTAAVDGARVSQPRWWPSCDRRPGGFPLYLARGGGDA